MGRCCTGRCSGKPRSSLTLLIFVTWTRGWRCSQWQLIVLLFRMMLQSGPVQRDLVRRCGLVTWAHLKCTQQQTKGFSETSARPVGNQIQGQAAELHRKLSLYITLPSAWGTSKAPRVVGNGSIRAKKNGNCINGEHRGLARLWRRWAIDYGCSSRVCPLEAKFRSRGFPGRSSALQSSAGCRSMMHKQRCFTTIQFICIQSDACYY